MKTELKNFFKLIICTLIFISSCKKEENTTINGQGPSSPCQTNNTCEITFTNKNSSKPYNCYVGGNYQGQVAGSGGTKTFTVSAGALTLKAEQASGYLFSPTVYTTNMSVGKCSSGKWEF